MERNRLKNDNLKNVLALITHPPSIKVFRNTKSVDLQDLFMKAEADREIGPESAWAFFSAEGDWWVADKSLAAVRVPLIFRKVECRVDSN